MIEIIGTCSILSSSYDSDPNQLSLSFLWSPCNKFFSKMNQSPKFVSKVYRPIIILWKKKRKWLITCIICEKWWMLVFNLSFWFSESKNAISINRTFEILENIFFFLWVSFEKIIIEFIFWVEWKKKKMKLIIVTENGEDEINVDSSDISILKLKERIYEGLVFCKFISKS